MKGFTLIETLVAAAIFILIISGIYGIMHIANISFSIDSGLVDLQQQARNAIYWIARETREASSVIITPISPNNDDIIFDTPSEAGVSYSLIGTQVIREYPPGVTKVIGDNITSLKFLRSGRILDIQLTASKSVLLRPLSFSIREQVKLRNE
ncbi:MAG: prepilin-type N-terminal cleavage/methylation domain-containing protein [Candidatus Omnitrophica bacterium]|nr:prepilin-type N-terminal cleavage/methylation domain-containing protein [Candidatus Omnitrophota bacterium]